MHSSMSQRVARPSLRVLVMQYIQRCGGSGLVHETSTLPCYEHASLALYPWIQLAMVHGNYTLVCITSIYHDHSLLHSRQTVVFLVYIILQAVPLIF